MSLEGSLETVALPEVLHLLADTSKSGELRVHGPRAEGRLWFDGGQLSGFEAGRCEQAVDALFELLRIDTGEFAFEAGAGVPDHAHRPGSPEHPWSAVAAIQPVLEAAQARLVEWGEIVAVVPSLTHEIYLRKHVSDGVVLEPAQWSLVVTIGEGRPVQDVLDRLSLPEFDGCKAVKQLVDSTLVEVIDPVAAAEAAAAEAARVAAEAEAVEAVEAARVAAEAEAEAARVEAKAARVAAEAEAEAARVEAVADDAHVEASDDQPTTEAGEALGTLLNGFTPADGSDVDVAADAPDGLADRGPWTSNELASLDQTEGWREEQPEPVAEAEHQDEVDASSEDQGEPTPEDEAAQP
ncbi:MAG TPA: DUF4388 domain-containing protein, partial [Acidimicrobiales bacterium]